MHARDHLHTSGTPPDTRSQVIPDMLEADFYSCAMHGTLPAGLPNFVTVAEGPLRPHVCRGKAQPTRFWHPRPLRRCAVRENFDCQAYGTGETCAPDETLLDELAGEPPAAPASGSSETVDSTAEEA